MAPPQPGRRAPGRRGARRGRAAAGGAAPRPGARPRRPARARLRAARTRLRAARPPAASARACSASSPARAERARGLRFDAPVDAVVVPPSRLRRVLASEVDAGFGAEDFGRAQAVASASGSIPQAFDLRVALLDLQVGRRRRVLHAARRRRLVLVLDGPGADALAPGTDEVAVHELVHALQDAHSAAPRRAARARRPRRPRLRARRAARGRRRCAPPSATSAARRRAARAERPSAYAEGFDRPESGARRSARSRATCATPFLLQYPLGYGVVAALDEAGGPAPPSTRRSPTRPSRARRCSTRGGASSGASRRSSRSSRSRRRRSGCARGGRALGAQHLRRARAARLRARARRVGAAGRGRGRRLGRRPCARARVRGRARLRLAGAVRQRARRGRSSPRRGRAPAPGRASLDREAPARAALAAALAPRSTARRPRGARPRPSRASPPTWRPVRRCSARAARLRRASAMPGRSRRSPRPRSLRRLATATSGSSATDSRLWNAEGRWQGQADPPLTAIGARARRRRPPRRSPATASRCSWRATSPARATRPRIVGVRLGLAPRCRARRSASSTSARWSGLTARGDRAALARGAGALPRRRPRARAGRRREPPRAARARGARPSRGSRRARPAPLALVSHLGVLHALRPDAESRRAASSGFEASARRRAGRALARAAAARHPRGPALTGGRAWLSRGSASGCSSERRCGWRRRSLRGGLLASLVGLPLALGLLLAAASASARGRRRPAPRGRRRRRHAALRASGTSSPAGASRASRASPSRSPRSRRQRGSPSSASPSRGSSRREAREEPGARLRRRRRRDAPGSPGTGTGASAPPGARAGWPSGCARRPTRNRERGWLGRPGARAPAAPRLSRSPSLSRVALRGLGAVERARASRASTSRADPEVRDAFLAVRANRTAHAWLWRHPGGGRAALLVCIHGYTRRAARPRRARARAAAAPPRPRPRRRALRAARSTARARSRTRSGEGLPRRRPALDRTPPSARRSGTCAGSRAGSAPRGRRWSAPTAGASAATSTALFASLDARLACAVPHRPRGEPRQARLVRARAARAGARLAAGRRRAPRSSTRRGRPVRRCATDRGWRPRAA